MIGVKICGLCRPPDAAAAVAAGADYVGVVFAHSSPRVQSPEDAAHIFAAARGARRAGVFMDEDRDGLCALGTRLELDVLQLHGAESAALVRDVREAGPWHVWKAVRPRSADEFLRAIEAYSDAADGLLVDGWSARGGGGVGARFDWHDIGRLRDRLPGTLTFIAAGGLVPDNVAEAVRVLAPDVVDTSSGVEQAICEKSPERMRAFVEAARAAVSPAGSERG